MKEINKDYIGVIRQKKNERELEYIQFEIVDRFSELSNKLDDMCQNPNRTVLDLQMLFEREIPKVRGYNGFRYCMPYNYSSSYLSGVTYPVFLTYNEYWQKIKEYSNMEYLNKSLKDDFNERAKLFISAYRYYLTRQKIENDGRNKMLSSEDIGWTCYEYQINEDLVFTVRSNFGYGYSSYFDVGIKYKGIDILPYSHVVKYYNANMQDIIQYTRDYIPDRSSWDIALQFVADTANEAISNEAEFIKKWIMDEVQEMMKGLSRLESEPNLYYSNIIHNNRDTGNLISVRNVLPEEIDTYKIYPSESEVAYQAEKISGALLLLNNLSQLTTIYPEIGECITRIINMNQGLLPRFKSCKDSIDIEVAKRKNIVAELEKIAEDITEQNKPHELKIDALYEEKLKKDGSAYRYSIREQYRNEHQDYSQNLDRLGKLNDEIGEKKSDISNRQRFASRLEKCINSIERYLQDAA